MKGSFHVNVLGSQGLGTYLTICAACLAQADARSGDPIAIRSYLGKSDSAVKAIAQFAMAYADQSEKDHQALLDAIDNGRVIAIPGV